MAGLTGGDELVRYVATPALHDSLKSGQYLRTTNVAGAVKDST